ncbi:hypothetical protein AMECASPLE_018726 [Ameca splendens]|uniref:Uncharacterized protein n=1 Tax=Ameca splendens TaxID=208324 RepID=A0ABV1AAA0_9TELE
MKLSGHFCWFLAYSLNSYIIPRSSFQGLCLDFISTHLPTSTLARFPVASEESIPRTNSKRPLLEVLEIFLTAICLKQRLVCLNSSTFWLFGLISSSLQVICFLFIL